MLPATPFPHPPHPVHSHPTPSPPLPTPSSPNHYALLLSLLDRTQSLSLTLSQAKSVHAQILRRGLAGNFNLARRLLSLYPSPLATNLLASLPEPPRGLLAFNLLISAAAAGGRHPLLALRLLSDLLLSGLTLDEFTLPSALNAAASLPSLPHAAALHALALKSSLIADPFVVSALVGAYAALGRPLVAEQMLDETPQRDLPTWNAALTGLSKLGEFATALRVFVRMLADGFVPNRTSLSGAATACGRLQALGLGRAIHGLAVRLGEAAVADVSVGAALVFMYAKCGDLESAKRVFASMPERNVVAWNSIISAHAQSGEGEEPWELFKEMRMEGFEAGEVTLTCMVTTASGLMEGKVIHGLVIKVGLEEEEILGAALVDMYGRLGSSVDARKVFDMVPRSEMGSWNSMILGYVRNGQPREALNLFYRLRDHSGIRPNSITLVGALSACAALGVIGEGRAIHGYIESNGIKVDLIVGTALIDMYAKCGSVGVAQELFEAMGDRDLVCWSVMISGHGVNGQVKEAMSLFDRMVNAEGLRPDNATFTSLLSACSHAGMVQEGWDYFDRMRRVYGLEPKNEQYACMVDLLGRAGKLDEAVSFIKAMPSEPDASVWGALLGACRIHNNIELGVFAAERLFELYPTDAGYYVLLSNLYAATGRWKDASRVRELMKSRGLQKPPGCSWVNLGGRIHEFYVGDRSHPQAEKIYEKLDELEERMRELGYVADTNLVLHDVDEEVKEDMLGSHSERLAIAFALISTNPGETIRVIKNLRVCADCHRATKLISKISRRKIVVRDARRFHHFENGECSCGDYW